MGKKTVQNRTRHSFFQIVSLDNAICINYFAAASDLYSYIICVES